MIKIGLTGGIGSGKTFVTKVFSNFNVPVYDSDLETKNIYQSNDILKNELILLFGNEVYQADGSINRKYLGNIVFQDKSKLNDLNKLVHPLVKLHFEQWAQNYQQFKYIIKESAILFESGAYDQVDKVIAVTAPDEVRIKRVIERDSIDRTSVLERMNNQLPQKEVVAKADYHIINDGKKAILPQVFLIHQELLALE